MSEDTTLNVSCKSPKRSVKRCRCLSALNMSWKPAPRFMTFFVRMIGYFSVRLYAFTHVLYKRVCSKNRYCTFFTVKFRSHLIYSVFYEGAIPLDLVAYPDHLKCFFSTKPGRTAPMFNKTCIAGPRVTFCLTNKTILYRVSMNISAYI